MFCLFISTVYFLPLYVFVPIFLSSISPSVHHFMFILYVKIFLPLLKQIKLYLFCNFFLCWFVKTPPPVGKFFPPRLPPITNPLPSISTSEQKKAIDNHATTFCCRLRPIRANHSTVGVVARRLLCVWFVAAWDGGRGQLSVCLPACPLPAPWLCLAVLALKGRRHTIGFTHLSITRFKTNQLSFHEHKEIHTAAMRMRGLFFVCGRLKAFSWFKSSSSS